MLMCVVRLPDLQMFYSLGKAVIEDK